MHEPGLGEDGLQHALPEEPRARLIVPWRGDGGQRDRLWAFCEQWWRSRLPEVPIVIGDSPPGPFNRSAAINRGAEGSWDVAVVLDADVVAPQGQVREAIRLAHKTGRMVLGFDRYLGFKAQVTEQVLGGWEGPWDRPASFMRRNPRHESSIVVIPRPLFERVGGFDERFEGWGQEDVAFCQAARVIGGGIERVPGPVYHLFHKPSAHKSRQDPLWQLAQWRGSRYRQARTVEAVDELLEEAWGMNRKRAFTAIYRRNGWNGVEAKAGPGSTPEATRELAKALPQVIEMLGVSSVLDAGCGDGAWMPDLPGYIGIDIVDEAIERCRERWPDRDYRVLDMCSDDLPQVDAIICRDTLQHLSLEDGLAALNNFRRSGAKWLLANTHTEGHNRNVAAGRFYSVNLQDGPFWLGDPVGGFIDDGFWAGEVRYPDKRFGAWEL